jgi:hypothetical protein
MYARPKRFRHANGLVVSRVRWADEMIDKHPMAFHRHSNRVAVARRNRFMLSFFYH